jgi:hypothetical protein
MRRGVRWCARVVRVGRGNEPSKRRERGTAPALFVVTEAGILVVTRAVLVHFIIEPSEKQSVAYGTVELQHTSPARSGRVFVPIVRVEGIGAFAEAPCHDGHNA